MIMPLASAVIWALLAPLFPATAVPAPASPATADAQAAAHPDLRGPLLQLQGTVADPETGEGIPDAWVFFDASPDSVRTDAEGRFALAAVPERDLLIEHPDYLGLRFPAEFPERVRTGVPPEYLTGSLEILAVPHRFVPNYLPVRVPLSFVMGPGPKVTATVSPGEGTWCGTDDLRSEEALERIEATHRISNGVGNYVPNSIHTETVFGDSARGGTFLVLCKPVT
jgi:hypothetical protein